VCSAPRVWHGGSPFLCFGANIPGFNTATGPFTAFQASHLGDYVWHCHILEHEDNDMMQRYVIQ
jgi:hypothetical protein